MKMSKLNASAAAVLFAVLLSLAPVGAQASGLASLIPNLFARTIVLAPNGHEAHFTDQDNKLATTGLEINSSIVAQLATFPLGSSAGGFTYTFDASLGVFTRSTDSFGPLYAERAQTLGKGKWNTGLSYLRTTYDKLDSLDLRKGDISFPLFHKDVNSDGTSNTLFFEGDVIEARSFLALDSTTSVLFATYGVTDRFDIGVAVPFQKVEIDSSATLTIDRIATSNIPQIHRFPDGSSEQTTVARGSASGLGDVVVRGKYRMWDSAKSGFAVALDVRLPTGNEKDLLGTGATRTKAYLVWSTAWGSFEPHVNAGYTVSSGGGSSAVDVPDEVNYAVGADFPVHPRVTIAVDAVGRMLRDTARFTETTKTLSFTTSTNPAIQFTDRPDLTISRGNVNSTLLSLGVRFNPAGNFLINANVLYSVTKAGLRDEGIIPLLGIDYSF
ncbi:MAG: transporter [Acidobacteriota bacterium]